MKKLELSDFEAVLDMEVDEAERVRKRQKYLGKIMELAESAKARQFFMTIRLGRRIGFTALDALSLNKRYSAYFIQYLQGSDALFLSEHVGDGIAKGADVVLAQMEDASLKAQEKALAAFEDYANPWLAGIFDVLFSGGVPSGIKREQVGECGLNRAQKECLEVCSGLAEGQFFLVHGPPGTGKTTTIVSIIGKAVEKGWKTLVSSHTNIAVDNIFEKLPPSARKKAVRVGNAIKTMESVHDLLQTEEDGMPIKETLSCDIEGSDVVGATLSKLGFLHAWKLLDWEKPAFDLVIIDEASMCSLPMCLLALLNGKRFVLAGDHHQLSPIFRSAPESIFELSPEARKSLFETLIGLAPANSRFLDVQYRGHRKIMDFVSSEFYGGALKTAPNLSVGIDRKQDASSLRPVSDPDNVLLWVDTSERSKGIWRRYGRAFSYVNEYEAALCTKIYFHLTSGLGHPKEDVAVITPFRLQSDLIKEQLWRASDGSLDVSTIQASDSKTVHAFQGREKKIVVYNLVLDEVFYRTTDRFRIFADSRMLNVALSRARGKLIVVGSSRIADEKELPTVFRLYGHVKKNGLVVGADGLGAELGQLDGKIGGCLAAITQR